LVEGDSRPYQVDRALSARFIPLAPLESKEDFSVIEKSLIGALDAKVDGFDERGFFWAVVENTESIPSDSAVVTGPVERIVEGFVLLQKLHGVG